MIGAEEEGGGEARHFIVYSSACELEGCVVDWEVAKGDPPVGVPSWRRKAHLWRINDYNV